MKAINFPLIDPLNTTIIRTVRSGFHVITFVEAEDGQIYAAEDVFETQETLGGEPDFKKVSELLYFLLDCLGVYNSKHHTHRIEIKVKKNRKDQ